jgi:hypothetical protein
MSSRSLGKIGDDIAVLSWNHFYCQGPTTLFNNSEIAPLRMRWMSSRSLGKISAVIAVLSWNNFYSQVTTALLINQETAPLRMRQTELALSWQYRF